MITLNQIACTLGTYTRYSGNIVGAVALDSLYLDQARGRYAVILHDFFGRVENVVAVCAEVHMRFFAYKLQAVAVSCCDNAFVAAGFARRGKGAEDIVGFIALAGHDFVSQQPEKLLKRRHLACELGRHTLTRSLIAAVHFVAEGGRFKVKGNSYRPGRLFLFYFAKHCEKAVNRLGKLPLFVCQGTDTVKRAVNNAVSVNNQQSHSLYITSVITPFL